MRSKHLDLKIYDTDKIDNQYLNQYDRFFNPRAEDDIKLLELGIYHGGSLQLWKDYFEQGTIVGVDLQLPDTPNQHERIKMYQGSQADIQFLSEVAKETAPEGFDFIIDDASHMGDLTKRSFWHLFSNHLKPGGVYVIEDWGTGYWGDWYDGRCCNINRYTDQKVKSNPFWMRSRFWLNVRKIIRLKIPMRSHQYGMVGFIKQLVDEQGASDAIRGGLKRAAGRSSLFEELVITPSLVFIRKAK